MWSTIIIFFIVLFTYIHIQHQWKTGEDIDIYEYTYSTHKSLQDTLQYKQPVLFDLEMPSLRDNPYLEILNIKDNREMKHEQMEAISLTNRSAKKLLESDTNSAFYSERNEQSIVQSESWTQWFETFDAFLKPDFTISRKYDLLYGSRKTQTITKFHHESHNYLYLPPESNSQPIRLKMTPWKYNLHFDIVEDYSNYEFWSRKSMFETNQNIKMLDFLVKPGHILYIPPYWFYSIEFQEKRNEVCFIQYTTGANALAHFKQIGLYYLQQQNIHEKWWKPLQHTNIDLIPINPEDDNKTENNTKNIDVSQNIINEPEKTIEESLIDDLKPKSKTE